MEKFSALEKQLLFKFLDDLEDHHNNAGCNDYDLPNTTEGRLIHEKSIRLDMSKSDADDWLNVEHEGDKITTMDFFVFKFLRNKLERILNEPDETV